jgi:nucleoside-diphosphate-sugar epimerase
LFRGGLEDEEVLKSFLRNARFLFHCAAELYDESNMWNVNVSGTERLLRIAKELDIHYLCYLSSSGVVGLTNVQWVNEETVCRPQNMYERSKWEAEQLVAQDIAGCRIVILRPTNVIDEQRPGALTMPIKSNWRSRLAVFLKGNECAHIIHAEDVADAALYFIDCGVERPVRFFVSCDHEQFNTFGGLWSLYKAIQRNRSTEHIKPKICLPIIIPHILRRLWRGPANWGNVRYSSEKLLSTGFRYRLGVEGTVRRIVASQRAVIS